MVNSTFENSVTNKVNGTERLALNAYPIRNSSRCKLCLDIQNLPYCFAGLTSRPRDARAPVQALSNVQALDKIGF